VRTGLAFPGFGWLPLATCCAIDFPAVSLHSFVYVRLNNWTNSLHSKP
jgi:hypothetical protein